MRIGLVRHFPVEEPLLSGWRTAAQLMEWRAAYESSPVIAGTVDAGAEPWARCLSSDLPRASATARAAWEGDIHFTPLLREAEFDAFRTGRLRLHTGLWKWVFRVAWLTGHRSQRARRDDFRSRVLGAADLIESLPEDTLVVSHAGMMIYLSAELRRRGFAGPKLRMPHHARLYLYERPAVR